MTTLKATVKKPRHDGFYSVYIRVTHSRKSSYIKTNKIVDAEHILENGDFTDPVVNEYCAMLIRQYTDRLNRVNTTLWSTNEVIDFLLKIEEEANFSDFARASIAHMIDDGHGRNAKNYQLAVNHLERYLGSNRIMFSQLTSTVLNLWIESLSKTNRAKEMYPTCVRQIFKKALTELNDEERGVIRVKSHFPPLRLLHSRQSIWQLSATVFPPSRHGVMWSASISSILNDLPQFGQMPFCLS